MKKGIVFLLLIITALAFKLSAQQINVTGWSSVRNMQNPCDSITLEISGDMDATYAQGPINVSVSGNTIDVEVIKIYGFATQPVSPNISWAENVEIGSLVAGTYTLNVTAKLSTVTYGFNSFSFTIDHDFSFLLDTTICFGDSILLNGKVYGMNNPTYSWSTGKQTQNIYASMPGMITLVATGSNCTVKDTMSLDRTDSIREVLGNDTALCLGDSLRLGPGPLIYTYKWKNNSTSNALIWNFTSEGTETVWVDVTDSNACTSRQEIVVVVEDCDTITIPGISKKDLTGMNVFPNPVNDILIVQHKINDLDPLQVRIIDSHGRLLKQQSIQGSSNEFSLQVNDLPAGIYIVEIHNSRTMKSETFIKN